MRKNIFRRVQIVPSFQENHYYVGFVLGFFSFVFFPEKPSDVKSVAVLFTVVVVKTVGGKTGEVTKTGPLMAIRGVSALRLQV